MTRHDPAMGGAGTGVGTPQHNTPPSLFDAPETAGRARSSDPVSSHEAARRVNVTGQRRELLVALVAEDPITADTMQRRHPRVHRSSWSSRLAGMRRDGLVEDGPPVVKTTRDGGHQTVQSFRLTVAGRVLARDHHLLDGDDRGPHDRDVGACGDL